MFCTCPTHSVLIDDNWCRLNMGILAVLVVKYLLVVQTSSTEGSRGSYSQGDGGMFDFDDLDEAEVLGHVGLLFWTLYYGIYMPKLGTFAVDACEDWQVAADISRFHSQYIHLAAGARDTLQADQLRWPLRRAHGWTHRPFRQRPSRGGPRGGPRCGARSGGGGSWDPASQGRRGGQPKRWRRWDAQYASHRLTYLKILKPMTRPQEGCAKSGQAGLWCCLWDGLARTCCSCRLPVSLRFEESTTAVYNQGRVESCVGMPNRFEDRGMIWP